MSQAGDGGTSLVTPASHRWEHAQVELLGDWKRRSAAAAEAHYRLATGLRRKNLALGVPAAVFAAVVGTSLFATLQKSSDVSDEVRFILGVVSVAAAILAGLQTFLRFGERAEKHVVAADWYSAIRRDVDELLALTGSDRGSPKEALDRIRKEMSKVGQQSPEIPSAMWEWAARRQGIPLTLRGQRTSPP